MRRRPTLLPSRAAYARWAATYRPEPHNPFMEIEQATLLDMLPILREKVILDLACGTGRWGRIAAEHGAARVISVDDSAAMLRQGHVPRAIQGSMTHLPLPPHCVDVILCGLAIGHVQNLSAALGEAKRVLRPGGAVLLSDVHPAQAWHGAQRTFKHQKKTFAVEHHIHSYADYHVASRYWGLTIDMVREVATTEGKAPQLLALRLTTP